jgi:hypothetical protein
VYGRLPLARGWPLQSKVERARGFVLTRSDVWVGELRSVRPLAQLFLPGQRFGDAETGAAWQNSKNVSGVGAPTRAAAGAPLPSIATRSLATPPWLSAKTGGYRLVERNKSALGLDSD